MKTASKVNKNSDYTDTNKGSTSYIFYGLLILLFYPPFFRGLFFQNELMVAHILTAAVFLLYFFANKRTEINSKYSWFEIGYFMLIGAYILSTIMAVNINLSIQETLKYINYLCILLLSKRLIDNKARLSTALTTIVVSGVIVVFIGIGASLDAFSYNGAFVGGMMSSTFQYHNTFGVYCLAMLFLTYMLSNSYSGIMKYFMGLSSYLFFFGFVLSYSRGAWVLLPLAGLVYYLLIPTKYKIGFIGGLLGNLAGIMVTIKKFSAIIESDNKSSGWLWLIIGIILSLTVSILIEKLLNKGNLKEKIYNLFIPIFAVSAPMLGLLFKNQILGLLPQDLAQRLGSISLGTETVTERTVFYKDALSIIKDYPIFGTGGGGWNTLYRAYQSYGYSSTQAHNYYMQLWVEIGTLGIVLFAALLIIYLVYSLKTYKQLHDPSLKAMFTSMFTAVMSILIHSVIDFDLALSAVAIIMWAMMGMQLGMYPQSKETGFNVSPILSYKAAGLAVVLLFISSTNYMAMGSAKQGIQAVQNKEIEKAEPYFKRASTFNPFESAYLADYANVSNAAAENANDKKKIDESIEKMDKAQKLGQYDSKMLINGARFYLNNGEIEKGLDAMHKLEEYHPLNSNTYENKSLFLTAIAQYYLETKKLEEAMPLLQEVADIEDKVNELNEEIKNNVQVITRKVKFVEILPKTKENIENAKMLLKKFK